ncbi:dTDP-4-dehydrorhamnose reductase [Calidifontibacter sp. DB0510]|uniref:dTDP-4-dehydrorhamnose reductase n=1 Tax=Metallococcus carri TaxID=1656884 RepID=A0A967B6D1_9MICO|nr:dTDP-4-dehydrorhamnose reductase [Metallococcus carri]NHN56412.1 dTDP-4-dehydrorhamnose reductase [Metallococcus carri]NOP36036.1 dTDP-4-dehydrorhamnose reductase [Calidifontibacter sp. DB2511S]
MTRWLVTGGRGMLGTEVVARLTARGEPFTGVGARECDIRDLGAVRRAVAGHDVVVNCAAYTAVDRAESEEAPAFAVNAVGAHHLALAARESGARLVHISTDYVFDGEATTPYAEEHPQAPRSAYGRSKAAGEWAVRAAHPDAYVVRTAWLYGAHGPNFVATMLRLAAERQTLSVVDDQRGQPTWAGDVAAAVIALAESGRPGGYYHATSAGDTTWHGFAREVLRLAGLDPQRVEPIATRDYPTAAPRPAYSVLAHEAWPALADWRAALQRSGLAKH